MRVALHGSPRCHIWSSFVGGRWHDGETVTMAPSDGAPTHDRTALARRGFFSIHYERDNWRENVVRNSWLTQDRIAAGFFDASLWEEAKKRGEPAIQRMIDDALKNTSVTAVLVGAQTATRKYVQYEIEQSVKLGKGLLGVRIEKIEDRNGRT